MNDQYETEDKADKYDLFKESNQYPKKVFEPTFGKILDHNLSGKRVIDLACGGGNSTKMLAKMGPSELVGVDLSAEMIRKAKKECSSNSKYSNIQFHVKNCTEPINLGQFDVVFSAHLLDYGANKQTLFQLYQTMYDSTKEGGMAAGVMVNTFFSLKDLKASKKYKKYGFIMDGEESDQVGKLNTCAEFYHKDQYLFSIHIWLWSARVHEEIARQVGFKRIEWHQPCLAEDEKNEDGFWDNLLNPSPFIFYKFYK